jgi:hypothetical protein
MLLAPAGDLLQMSLRDWHLAILAEIRSMRRLGGADGGQGKPPRRSRRSPHGGAGDGTAPTVADVTSAIMAVTGEEMSSATVWKLGTGRGGNPTSRRSRHWRPFCLSFGYFGAGDAAALLTLLQVVEVSWDRSGLSRNCPRALDSWSWT